MSCVMLWGDAEAAGGGAALATCVSVRPRSQPLLYSAQANPASAEAQRDVAVNLDRLGDVAWEAGDLAGAQARYEEDVVIFRKLAQVNPTSAEAQRDVSIALNKFGDMAWQAGDQTGARARYKESLSIRRKLAQANPTSAQAQRDLLRSLVRLGETTGDGTLLREALVIGRALDHDGRLESGDRGLLDRITKAIDGVP